MKNVAPAWRLRVFEFGASFYLSTAAGQLQRPTDFDVLFSIPHSALNAVSQSQVVANGINFLITNFETVEYTGFMKAKSKYLQNLLSLVLLTTQKKYDLLLLLVVSINSSVTWRGR